MTLAGLPNGPEAALSIKRWRYRVIITAGKIITRAMLLRRRKPR